MPTIEGASSFLGASFAKLRIGLDLNTLNWIEGFKLINSYSKSGKSSKTLSVVTTPLPCRS